MDFEWVAGRYGFEVSFDMVNPVTCIQKYNRNNILHTPVYKYTIRKSEMRLFINLIYMVTYTLHKICYRNSAPYILML